MARATRPNQVIRDVLLVLAFAGTVALAASAGTFGGKEFSLMIPKGWSTRPGFDKAEVLVASPQNGANLNVVVSPAQEGLTLEEGARALTIGPKGESKFKTYGKAFTKLDGVTALAIEYAYNSPNYGQLRIRQVLAIRNNKTVVVTCMTKAAAWQRMWPAFKGMIASFRWKK
jgi:hypothetical protein